MSGLDAAELAGSVSPAKVEATTASRWAAREPFVAAVALVGIAAALVPRSLIGEATLPPSRTLLAAVLVLGGLLLVPRLAWQALHGRFGADHLAGISIVSSAVLGEYLAGAIVVLMLSGGETLQQFAVKRATAALRALATRAPTLAHRHHEDVLEEVAVADIRVGDELAILPGEVCPVDGEVVSGRGAMDESYLTGEPFTIPKGPGSKILSGAINGDSALRVRATRLAADSRFAQIMHVLRDAEQRRPRLRRIGDEIGAWYTPIALVIAGLAWWWTADPVRFLSVLVVATPCPLLIAIPVAIIGAISSASRHGIIVKDPAALEQLTLCRTMILDKTGTLTYGQPALSEELYEPTFTRDAVLPIVAAIERYSRHPIAGAIVAAATKAGYALPDVAWIREEPGVGLYGQVGACTVLVTGRAHASTQFSLPPSLPTGLECIVVMNGRYAATYRFLDLVREDSRRFVGHLGPKHGFTRVLLVSGDRAPEVRRLAAAVAIDEAYPDASPEGKVAIVRRETRTAKTAFVGDGINDAPALLSATVGIAFGRHSDVTSEAAKVVIIDSSLTRVDELMHVSHRLRRVALQSALGGMSLSVGGMIFAAFGLLSPVAGAIAQEVIDLLAVLNASRTARPVASDFRQ